MSESMNQSFIDAANNIVKTSGEVQKSLNELTIQMQSIASDLKHVTKDHAELKAMVIRLDEEREKHANRISALDSKVEQLMELNDTNRQQGHEILLLTKSVRDLEDDIEKASASRKEGIWHIVRGLAMPIALMLFAAWISYND